VVVFPLILLSGEDIDAKPRGIDGVGMILGVGMYEVCCVFNGPVLVSATQQWLFTTEPVSIKSRIMVISVLVVLSQTGTGNTLPDPCGIFADQTCSRQSRRSC
jgi:hypothetical protein